MKITFIGTSHGVPEANRRCSCTMLEISGKYYFIDMGTQAIEDIVTRGIDVNSIAGIFLTHPHGDHSDGLISFVDLINWYYKSANPAIFLPRKEMIDAIRSWLAAALTSSAAIRDVKMDVVKEGQIYDDGTLKVTAIPTKHCPYAYAYFLEAEGKNILFTGDMKHPYEDFPQVAFEKPMDLIVSETAHFPTQCVEEVLKKADVKQVVINHFPAYRDADYFNVAQNEHPYILKKASDGLEITL